MTQQKNAGWSFGLACAQSGFCMETLSVHLLIFQLLLSLTATCGYCYNPGVSSYLFICQITSGKIKNQACMVDINNQNA